MFKFLILFELQSHRSYLTHLAKCIGVILFILSSSATKTPCIKFKLRIGKYELNLNLTPFLSAISLNLIMCLAFE